MSSNSLGFLGGEPVPVPIDDIYYHLTYLRQYLAEVEEFLEREASREASRVEETMQKLSAQDDDFVFVNAVIRDRLESLQDYFPNILRKSLFVAIHSTIEPELDWRCGNAQKSKNQLFAAGDLARHGNGLKRYIDYLSKVAGIIPPKAEWDKLQDYEKLRDCVVHCQGNVGISRDEAYLRKYITRHEFLELSSDEVIMKQGFCEEVISDIEVFFKNLAKA